RHRPRLQLSVLRRVAAQLITGLAASHARQYFLVRGLSLHALVIAVCLVSNVFAQEDTSSPDDQSTPADQATPPSGPVLQPANYTPTVCDPSASGFRYEEVRGSGFDAFAGQRLVGSVVDGNGAPQAYWSSVWVT